MQGMIDRNESLTHRSFLAVRGPFGSIPLLLRRALGAPAERLTQGGFVALFSRKKKPATAPQANPFVTDRAPASPDPTPTPGNTATPPEQPEEFARRPAGRPEATFPRSKRVSMSLTEAEHQAWVSAADGQPLSTWARHQVQAQLEAGAVPDGVGGAELQRLRADLGRVGSNLNQLTRGMHQGQLVEVDELVESLRDVSAQLA